MQCPRCQHENPADATFCQECGARLETACPSCATPNQLGAKFCKKCGQRLSQPEAAQAVPGPRFGSAESYTPKHLAEKILTSKAALEGERKQVTVLFADLKGSMELLADRDPEEARKLLDPVLERMMEAVHRYEGTVNQVMGDGIMALFGAPLAHEDHAVRACYAALRMQESVAQYAEGVFRTHGVPLQIRVGLNSGEVVVRAIGSDLHMDYTAVGQTTHLAARMEQMATPGTILLAPATLQLAEGYVEVSARGPVAVKGVPDPVDVCPPCWPCSMYPSRTLTGRRSIPPSAGSAPWRPSSASCSGRARVNRSSWSSRTCTGSMPRRRPCSTAWSRVCPRPGSYCSSTTGPSTSTAG
jgi:class 3 adenylate cyclase